MKQYKGGMACIGAMFIPFHENPSIGSKRYYGVDRHKHDTIGRNFRMTWEVG
jgi:hypothetical protein